MKHPVPPRRVLRPALALVAAFAAGAAAAETATVLKATPLRAAPDATSDVVVELEAKQAVEIAGRQGAWANVKTSAGAEGWTRVLNLRTGTGGVDRSGGGQALAGVFATGSSASTSTTAAKGLSAKTLASAYADAGQLAALDAAAVDPADARAFAASAPLQAQSVAYVPDARQGRRRSR